MMMDEDFNKLPSGLGEFFRSLGVRSIDSTFDQLRDLANRQLSLGSSGHYESHAPKRWEDSLIEGLVKTGDRVLDLGCGDGELLVRLVYRCGAEVQGIETNEDLVIRCIERGVPVCHDDLEQMLSILPDRSFDIAVMENTLQTLVHPLDALRGMLRVARIGVVSFPNFAHWSVRLTLGLGGRMPVTSSLPYTWYDTPNIHLCSINDFTDWVVADDVEVLESWVLVEGKVEKFNGDDHNKTAEQAMFVIKGKDSMPAGEDR